MVAASYDPAFRKAFEKIKDAAMRERVKKHIRKIVETPDIGKPMRYVRKGTREVHVAPYRISYALVREEIIFLAMYHKDEQ